MKKIIVLVLGIFLMFGCSGQNNKYKDEAIKAYVENTNRLNKSEKFSLNIQGDIDVPKSLATEGIKASLTMDGKVDVKDFLMYLNISMNDNTTTNNQDIKIYLDKEYSYINYDGTWVKESVGDEIQKALDEMKGSKQEELTVEAATQMFDTFKETKYSKASQDGNDGYLINAKLDLESIISLINQNEEHTKEIKAQIEQFKQLAQQMDITYNVFVPIDEDKFTTHELSMNLEVLNSKINVGPIKIAIEPTEDKIEIPKEAKKAKSTNNSSSTGIY